MVHLGVITLYGYYNLPFCYSRTIAYFCQNRYSHQQAAILRGTFHRFFRGRDSMKWNEESRR